MSVSASDFGYVRALLERRSAIHLEEGKEYLVEARLAGLSRATGAGSVTRLVAQLRSSPEGALHTRVVDALTTNETSWFRDRHPYDAFGSVILPDLLRRRAAVRRLTMWSAAAASGQEPYSIAMMLHERLAGDPSWRTEIRATDLSAEMVDRTRIARYSQLEVNRGLPASRLVRHFSRVGAEWEVNAALRALVQPAQLNLAAPLPPMPPMDVVFLRNVLIYFALPTKRAVLAAVRSIMRPDGYLILGGAETTYGIDDAFERIPYDRAAIYRIRGGQVAV